jgi:hypothetical protein
VRKILYINSKFLFYANSICVNVCI